MLVFVVVTVVVDVTFSEYFYTITVFSLDEEYVAHFPIPDDVFLPCDTGWIFCISLLCEDSINQIQSTRRYYSSRKS